jgi:dTMP kinase
LHGKTSTRVKKGFFIVFEGSDGSGKSTQAKRLHRRLLEEGVDCLLTEEPGGTAEGRHIRELVLDPECRVSPKTELFLFLADRAGHVDKVIRPALESGKTVICSRYFYSTLVYQGIARRLAEIEFLEELNLFSVSNILPDIVFLIDVHPGQGLSKAKAARAKPFHRQGGDRIEQQGEEFQERVRRGYLELADRYKKTFVVIDGSRDIREVGETIYVTTKEMLKGEKLA